MEGRLMTHDLQTRIDALGRIAEALCLADATCVEYTDKFTDEPAGDLSLIWETVDSIGAALLLVIAPIVEYKQQMLDQSSCDKCDEFHPGNDLVTMKNGHLCKTCVTAELLQLRQEQGERSGV